MNLLLLSNGAPKYFNFFNALSRLFMQDGASVFAAVDSRFSYEENRLEDVGFKGIHVFSDFFAGHRMDREILSRYAKYDLNGALLSDFERAYTYGVWDKSADINYFDRLKSALLAYYEDIFERHLIDAVLYENVSNTFAHYALFVAQEKGITYHGLASSRLPGRFTITSDPLNDNATEKAFDAIRNDRLAIEAPVREWASDYLDRIETIVPDYMNINGLDRISVARRYLRGDRLRKLPALLRHMSDSRTTAFQIGNPLRTYLALFLRNIRRRLRSGLVQKLYQSPVESEHYLLYPLHFHPESSTSILAGTYLDEYEVIRNIAFRLPEGMRLYVKDHVSAWAYPTMDFYRRLTRLPNVRLLGPNEPTKAIIKRSSAVITLTSTVGYEALLLKKRVFVYGSVFYDFHAGAVKVENPARLHDLLKDHLSQPIEWSDEYNNDFVSACYMSTWPGSLNLMQDGEEADAHARDIYPSVREVIFNRPGPRL